MYYFGYLNDTSFRPLIHFSIVKLRSIKVCLMELVSNFNQVAIILISILPTHGHQCKVTSRTEHGLVLFDHVYKSFTVPRLAACYSACNIEPSCQSLNYKLADKICQFNNQTRRSKPEKLKLDESFIFAENPDRGTFFFFLHFSSTRYLRFLCLIFAFNLSYVRIFRKWC